MSVYLNAGRCVNAAAHLWHNPHNYIMYHHCGNVTGHANWIPPPPAYGSKGRRDLTLSRLLVGESIRAPAAASVENNQCVQPDSSSVAPVRPPVAALSAVVLSSTIFKWACFHITYSKSCLFVSSHTHLIYFSFLNSQMAKQMIWCPPDRDRLIWGSSSVLL